MKSTWIVLLIMIACSIVPLWIAPMRETEAQVETTIVKEEGNTQMVEEISKATGLPVHRAKSIEATLLMAGKKDATGFILQEDLSGETFILSFTSEEQLFKAILTRNMFVEYILDSNDNLVFAIEE